MAHSIRNLQGIASKILFYNKSVGDFDCVLIQLTSIKYMLCFVNIHKEETCNFWKKVYLWSQMSNTHLPKLQTVYSRQKEAKRFNYQVSEAKLWDLAPRIKQSRNYVIVSGHNNENIVQGRCATPRQIL
jgi:hypothetical protein